PAPGKLSSAKAWARALELTAPIVQRPDRILPTVIEELAEQFGSAPALLSDRECLTYRALAERSSRYARWAIQQGLAKGDVVCLLMPNRPEYMAIWLGITRVGGVVALVNTNLAGPSLAHCINTAAPAPLIVAAEPIHQLTAVRPDLVRETFSARHCWRDVVRWDCTLFQYIGELCRYLLHTDPHPPETDRRSRMCCGNGLRPDVWNRFKERFRIPHILEFYAATEGNVS